MRARPLNAPSSSGTILDHVGQTPLVPLRRIFAGELSGRVEIWAKLEAFNPSGSVKARAALNIILEAEKSGRLEPGGTLLDASSGNTGIAYAMIAAARGYRLKLCLPANANHERKQILKAYGVELIITSPLEGSDGAIHKAKALAAENPDWFYCDQYSNDANWQAHFKHTGPEIWAKLGGRITHFVAGLGTSGTFMGVSRFLKSQDPSIQCHSVEPDSPFHGLEGLKHMETALVPSIYDPTVADSKLEAPTEESFELVQKLAATEGILVGPSCAAALWGVRHIAQQLEQGVIVTVFPDSGERYLSDSHIWEAQ